MNNEKNATTDIFALPGVMSTSEYILHIRAQAYREQGRAFAEFVGRVFGPMTAALRKFLAGNGAADRSSSGRSKATSPSPISRPGSIVN